MRHGCSLAAVLLVATAIHAEGARAEPSAPPPAPSASGSPPRIAAWVLIGSGIASFAAGIPSRASITGASYTVRC